MLLEAEASCLIITSSGAKHQKFYCCLWQSVQGQQVPTLFCHIQLHLLLKNLRLLVCTGT